MKKLSSVKKRFLAFFYVLSLVFGTCVGLGTSDSSVNTHSVNKLGATTVSSWTAAGNNTSTVTLSSTYCTVTITGSTGSVNCYSQNGNISVTPTSTTSAVSISGWIKVAFSSTIQMTSLSFNYGQCGLKYGTVSCNYSDASLLHYPANSTASDVCGSNGSNPNASSSNDKSYLNTMSQTPNATSASYTITYSGTTGKTDNIYTNSGLIVSVANFSVTMERSDQALTATTQSVSVQAKSTSQVSITGIASRTMTVGTGSTSIATATISTTAGVLSTVTITGVGFGSTTITVYAAQSDSYTATSIAISVSVTRIPVTESAPSTSFVQKTNTINGLSASYTYTLYYGSSSFNISGVSSYTVPQTYKNKTITGIVTKARATTSVYSYSDSSKASVSYLILPKESAPSLTYNSITGELIGLTNGKTYTIRTSTSDVNLTATGATMDLASNDAFKNLKLVSASLQGTYSSGTAASTDTIDSDFAGISGASKVYSHADLSGLSYGSSTGYLTGLVASKTYTLTYLDTSSATQTLSITPTATSYDLASLTSPTLTGCTLTSIKFNGDSETATDATKDLGNAIVYGRLVTPTATYTESTGYITGLEAGEKYSLTYTSTSGDSLSYALATDGTDALYSNDKYDLSAAISTVSTLSKATIVSLTLLGDGTSSTDSAPETDSIIATKIVYPREAVGEATYNEKTGFYEGVSAAYSYDIGYTSSANENLDSTLTVASGESTLDIATLISDSAPFSLTSIVKKGVNGETIDSYTSSLSKRVYQHAATPNLTFTSKTGYLTGLTNNISYTLVYTLAGETEEKTLTFSASTSDTLYNATAHSYDLSAVTGLSNATAIKVKRMGDYSSTCDSLYDDILSNKVLDRETTTTESFSLHKGKILGLVDTKNYKIGYTDSTGTEATPYAFSATSGTTGYDASEKSLDLTTISSFIGAKVTSIMIEGDGTTSADSYLTDEKNTQVLPHEATPTGDYSSANGYLTGLDEKTKYTLSYINKDGEAKEYAFTTTGSSFDLAEVSDLSNGTIKGLCKNGDYVATSDSLDKKAFTDTTIIPREVDPVETADKTKPVDGEFYFTLRNGTVSGLEAGGDYLVAFTDGSSKEVQLGATETSVDLSIDTTLSLKVLASITKKGDATTTIDSHVISFIETDAKDLTIYPHFDTPTATFISADGYLNMLDESSSYTLRYKDTNGEEKEYSFASGTSTSLDVGSIKELAGGTLISLRKNNDLSSANPSHTDSLLQTSLNGLVVIPREADPIPNENKADPTEGDFNYTYTDGLLSGLAEGGIYLLKFTDGSTKTITLTGTETSIDLSSDTSISGKVLSSITKKGDGTTSIDSHEIFFVETEEDEKTIYPHFETPTTTFVSTDGYLNNLVSGASYTITYADEQGTIKEYSFVSGTSTSLDLASVKVLAKATLISVHRNNDLSSSTPTHSDSLEQNSLSGLVVIPRLATPITSFNEVYGEISGLTPDKEYEVTFSDGSSTNYTSDSKGIISLSDHEELSEKKITAIAMIGDPTSTTAASLTSYDETVSDLFPSVAGVKEELRKEALEKLKEIMSDEETKDPDNDLSDEAIGVGKDTKDTITTYDPSAMTINEWKDYLAETLTETSDEVDFEVIRTSIIEEISSNKRNCADETLDKYIEGAITRVKNQGYTYATRTEDLASLYTIRDESLTGIKLIVSKISATEAIDKALNDDLSSGRNPIGYEDKAKSLTEEYTTLINGANNEAEVQAYEAEYLAKLTSLRAEYASGAHCFMHWIDIALLGAYLLFAIIYGLIFKHHNMDAVYAAVGVLTLAITIALSFFIYDLIDIIAIVMLFFVLIILNVLLLIPFTKKKEEKSLAYEGAATSSSSVILTNTVEEDKQVTIGGALTNSNEKKAIAGAEAKEETGTINNPPIEAKKEPYVPEGRTILSHIYGKKSKKGRR